MGASAPRYEANNPTLPAEEANREREMDLKLLESLMRAFCPQTNKGHFNVPEGYNFRGAVFDLDGVVTQTSHLHEEAWKQLFDEFLHKKKNESQAQGDDPADTK